MPSQPLASLTTTKPAAALSTVLALAILSLGIFPSTSQTIRPTTATIHHQATDPRLTRTLIPGSATVQYLAPTPNLSRSIRPLSPALISFEATNPTLSNALTPSTATVLIQASNPAIALTTQDPAPVLIQATDPNLSRSLPAEPPAQITFEAPGANAFASATNIGPGLATIRIQATDPALTRTLNPNTAQITFEATDATLTQSSPAQDLTTGTATVLYQAPIPNISRTLPAQPPAQISFEATDPALTRTLIPGSAQVLNQAPIPNLSRSIPAEAPAQILIEATDATIQPALGPLTLDYISRVQTAGGTVSNSAASLLDQVLYNTYSDDSGGTGKVADFITAFAFLWSPYSTFNALLVPVRGTNFTNTGFVSGDYTPATGLQCGSGKHLDTNFSTGSIPRSNDTGLGYVGDPWRTPLGTVGIVIGAASSGGSNAVDIGVTNTTNQFRQRVWATGTTTGTQAGTTVIQAYRTTSTSTRLQLDGAAPITANVANNAPGSRNYFVGARNTFGTPTFHHNGILQAAWVTNRALTLNESRILNNAMQHMRANRPSIT